MAEVEAPRDIAFFADGMRMSIAMTRLLDAEIRSLVAVLEDSIRAEAENQSTLVRLTMALWLLVDATHRLRELAQQAPRLKKSTPEFRLFLRATESVEVLRNYVQHLNTEIRSLPQPSTPVWGVVSWVSRNDPKVCITAFTGLTHAAAYAYSIAYDTWNHRFTQDIILSVNNVSIDAPALIAEIECFSAVVERWASDSGCGLPSSRALLFTVRAESPEAPG